MARPIELRLLQYFVAVADERNITRAAQRLGIAQPPLSQQIRSLEQRLGASLFERHPAGVALTRAGEALLERARRVLAEAEALVPHVRQAARGRHRRLRVGLTTSAALHATASELLRRSLAGRDDLFLELHDGNAQDLTEQLLEGKLDFALLRTPVLRPGSLVALSIGEEPVLLALPAAHRLCGRAGKTRRPGSPRASLELATLKDEDFILVRRPGQPGIYEDLLQACAGAGFEPRIIAEVPRMLACLSLVAAGMGISVVPASMRPVQAEHVRYLLCVGLEGVRAPLTLLHRGRENDAAVREVVRHAAALAEERQR